VPPHAGAGAAGVLLHERAHGRAVLPVAPLVPHARVRECEEGVVQDQPDALDRLDEEAVSAGPHDSEVQFCVVLEVLEVIRGARRALACAPDPRQFVFRAPRRCQRRGGRLHLESVCERVVDEVAALEDVLQKVVERAALRGRPNHERSTVPPATARGQSLGLQLCQCTPNGHATDAEGPRQLSFGRESPPERRETQHDLTPDLLRDIVVCAGKLEPWKGRSRALQLPLDQLVDGAIRSQSESFSGRASIKAGTSNSTLPTRNLVGGEWLDAVEDEVEGVVNPATGETIAAVPRGTEADVDRAVEAATGAVPEWRETTPQERAEALLRLADALTEHAEELARVEIPERREAPALAAGNTCVLNADQTRYGEDRPLGAAEVER
jgi:hypothetical protein